MTQKTGQQLDELISGEIQCPDLIQFRPFHKIGGSVCSHFGDGKSTFSRSLYSAKNLNCVSSFIFDNCTEMQVNWDFVAIYIHGDTIVSMTDGKHTCLK